MIVAGIDIGSMTTKTVVLRDSEILASVMLPTGANSRTAADRCLEAAMAQCRLRRPEIARIVATGYGRASFPADKTITEITCHARGAF
ncbi:MAG TPA: BadF/BadG/BcrA/BcrD ATPase family protein, partial [Thermodesulfobacteriota bacterium]|nr:BadF/BadG/BcrA/BcrD ATPase family protein [Thermodesulfobacteriota bacterium]